MWLLWPRAVLLLQNHPAMATAAFVRHLRCLCLTLKHFDTLIFITARELKPTHVSMIWLVIWRNSHFPDQSRLDFSRGLVFYRTWKQSTAVSNKRCRNTNCFSKRWNLCNQTEAPWDLLVLPAVLAPALMAGILWKKESSCNLVGWAKALIQAWIKQGIWSGSYRRSHFELSEKE